MTRQTKAMIDAAGSDTLISATLNHSTGQFHGILLVNHPAPSGAARWLVALSDKRGWPNEKIAKAEMKKLCK